MSNSPWLSKRACFLGFALGLAACAPKPALPSATTPPEGVGPAAARPGVVVVSLRGHIRLDPRAHYQHDEGDLWQHVFYLDGELFDALLCYAHTDRCALVDLHRESTPRAWSAKLSESFPDTTPFVAYFDVPPDGDWRTATRVAVRVVVPGLGEVGATTLEPDPAARPPMALRERLRGEERVRRVYESLSLAYRISDPASREFPASHPERPSPPPCGPTWVRDQEAVAWLGLSAPVVLSWAFSVEADREHGTLRVIARRDLTCHGDIESLVLSARLDEYGDFERLGIESSTSAPRAHTPP